MSLTVNCSVSSFNVEPKQVMTLLSFFGCGLTAYGPALAIFFLYIAKNAQLVLLMVSR